MTLRRKTARKATYDCWEGYRQKEACLVKDAGDFFILQGYRDDGHGYTKHGTQHWIGKGVVEALHNLSGQYYGFGG